jgi:hypothetical protein
LANRNEIAGLTAYHLVLALLDEAYAIDPGLREKVLRAAKAAVQAEAARNPTGDAVDVLHRLNRL